MLVRVLAVLAFILAAGPATAQFVGSGGNSVTTVQRALSARVGSYVTLQGQIRRHFGDEYYIFADKTGTARIEIPNELWRGRQVTPRDTLRIRGEVDRDPEFARPFYLWVVSLQIIKPPS